MSKRAHIPVTDDTAITTVPAGFVEDDSDLSAVTATPAAERHSELQRPAYRGLTDQVAEALIATNGFARDAGGDLHHYTCGVYVPCGVTHIGQQVKELLQTWGMTGHWSKWRVAEVMEYIRSGAQELWARPPLGVINLRNGLLDVTERKIRRHSPMHLSATQLPTKYEPAATCLVWYRFVATTFPGDAQMLAWEVIA